MTDLYKMNQGELYAVAVQTLGRLNIPPGFVKLRPGTSDKLLDVYDFYRRRWVALTPEEWVRQHFVEYMVNHLGFSPFRIANEVSLKFNKMNRRADTVVYDDKLKPLVIVEYKAADVPLDKHVLEQVLRYNLVFEAPALMVCNGLDVITVAGNVMRRGPVTFNQLQEASEGE